MGYGRGLLPLRARRGLLTFARVLRRDAGGDRLAGRVVALVLLVQRRGGLWAARRVLRQGLVLERQRVPLRVLRLGLLALLRALLLVLACSWYQCFCVWVCFEVEGFNLRVVPHQGPLSCYQLPCRKASSALSETFEAGMDN